MIRKLPPAMPGGNENGQKMATDVVAGRLDGVGVKTIRFEKVDRLKEFS
jgi:hypothetical protein